MRHSKDTATAVGGHAAAPDGMGTHRISRRSLLGGSAALGVAGAGAFGLSGCSGSGSAGSRAGGGSSGGQGGTADITVALTAFSSKDTINAATGRKVVGVNTLLKEFAKDNPSINVKAIDINANGANATQAKEQTLLLSGQADILQGATLWPYYTQGLILDLNKYFTADNWESNYLDVIFTPPMERLMFPPWVDKPTTHLSSPGDLETLSLAYDKKLFEDFGVEPLADVPTIEEVLFKAAKLTGTNPKTGKKCYGMYYDPRGQAHIMLYYLGHGVDFGKIDKNDPSAITFDTPQIKAGIQSMINISKYCPPGFEIGQGAENWGASSNTVAIDMSVSPSGMLPAVQNKLTDRFVVTKGVRDTAGHTFYVASLEYAIGAKCKNPDAAWKVIKFLSGAQGQKYAYQNYNDLPSWKDQDWVDNTDTPYAQQFMGAAKAAKNAFFPEFVFKVFRPWVASVVSKAIHGQHVDLDSGLASMQKKAEQWVKDGADGLAKYE